MREILFRGKRTNNGKWVYGYLAVFRNYTNTPYTAIIQICDEETKECSMHDLCAVLPETVGEYTGLTDKNGKKIFEGDRVTAQFWSDWGECYEKSDGEVMYDNGKYIIYISHYCMKLDLCAHPEIEVIGNIYETLDKK